jgi:hypothetical protein
MTRNIIITAVALAALSLPAFAADLPIKAPPLSNIYPTSKCGLYYGVVVQGSSGVVNGAPAGTVQIGGDVGGLIGYACPTSAIPWFVEFDAMFQNLNAGNAGFAMSGPAHLEAEAAIETPLVALFGQYFNIGQSNIPGPSVWLPTGYSVNGPATSYVGIVTAVDDISASSGVASAHEWLWTPLGLRTGLLFNLVGPNNIKMVGDAFAGLNFQSNAISFGSALPNTPNSTSAKIGEQFVMGFKLKL